jgi:hypothetical protein
VICACRDQRRILRTLGGSTCKGREGGDCVGGHFEARRLLGQSERTRSVAIERVRTRDPRRFEEFGARGAHERVFQASDQQQRPRLQRWPCKLVGTR